MRRLIPALGIRLKDEDAERVRRNVDERISQLQSLDAVALTALGEHTFADATEVVIAHKLGRTPLHISISPVVGAASSGRFEEVRGDSRDRTKYISLKATGFGATVTATVAVM